MNQSLFVVVDYDYSDKAPYFCSILQLDMENEGNKHENEVIETKFSVNFCLPQPQSQSLLAGAILWSFSPLAISSTDEEDLLYMVPDMLPLLVGKPDQPPVPLHGCIYNLRNNKYRQINPPQAPKHSGHVVSMGGHLYFMAYPRSDYLSSPIFERHDPLSDCWEALPPFPYCYGVILATVVLDDTILFNLGHYFCAYHAPSNKWCPVTVDNDLAYCIIGEALVLGDTIYALEDDCFNLVLVFSVGRKGNKDDLEFQFSLVSEIIVSGIKEIESGDMDVLWRHLAYLGNHNFCLVQCCELDCPKEYQSIQVINMKLEGDYSMTVTNTRFYKLKIDEGGKQFRVRLCFSLPNCTTTAVEEGKPSVFEFDPFPEHTVLKQEREYITDCHGDHADTTLEVLNHEASLLHIQTQATPTPAYPAYPRTPAIPSPPPYYQHPDPHYPRTPAVPSPPSYYQHPRPQPPNTPQPWPSNPQPPLLLTPTAPKTNNQRPVDCCQLCGFQGHIATSCFTYSYYKNPPRPPYLTT